MKRSYFSLLCLATLICLAMVSSVDLCAEEIDEETVQDKPFLWDRLEDNGLLKIRQELKLDDGGSSMKKGKARVKELEQKVMELEAQIEALKRKCAFQESSNNNAQ